MRILPAGMEAALVAGSANIAWLYRLTAFDGTVKRFTTWDADISWNSETFLSDGGVENLALDNSNAVKADNAQLNGFVQSVGLPFAELRAGKWDGAKLEIYWSLVDDPVSNTLLVDVRTLGEVSRKGNIFEAEARGLQDRMNHDVGRIVTPRCHHDPGDAGCGLDMTDWKHTAEVDVVQDDMTILITNLDDAEATAPSIGFYLPLVNADFSNLLNGWQQDLGTWQVGEKGDPHARSGEKYERARPDDTTDDVVAALSQTIDLVAAGLDEALIDAGGMSLKTAGWIKSARDNDRGGITIVFIDEFSVDMPGESYTTGMSAPSAWTQKQVNASIPANARSVRVELHAESTGSKDADVGFDDLTMEVFGNGVVAATGWFDGGKMIMTSGALNGQTLEVGTWTAETLTIRLFSPMASQLSAGDTFDLYPGCSRTRANCILFDNISNFGGFPDVPGGDQMGYVPGLRE